MTTTKIFVMPNNDGSGRSDYHVEVTGKSHSAVFGPFRRKDQAVKMARRRESERYWDTGEGHYFD